MDKVIIVNCPQCETQFSYYTSEFRPFCSERCKQIDLGHWFQETYTVPAQGQTPDAEKVVDVEENEENNDSEYEH